jgi:hypothetical protein
MMRWQSQFCTWSAGGAAPSAWQALPGAAHVGPCGVVMPRCAATAGVLFRRSSSCQLSRAARREAVASDRRARSRWHPAPGSRPHPRRPPARSLTRRALSTSRTRTAQPPTHGMDDQRSVDACVVLPCNSLPSLARVPSPSVDATCRRPRPAVARRPCVRCRLDLRLDGEASIPATGGTSGQYCAWL